MMRKRWGLLAALSFLVACQPPDGGTEPPAGINLGNLKLFADNLGADSAPGDVQIRFAEQSMPADSRCPTESPAPFNANELHNGLYWYAPGTPAAPGGEGCRARSDGAAIPGFYDPQKPVLIFVHGWNNGYVQRSVIAGTSLAVRRENFWFNAAQLNVADAWIEAGWNVGIYQWTQLADDEGTYFMPFNAQAKIWTPHYQLTDGTRIGMRYRTSNGSYSALGAPQVSAGELFYQEYKTTLSQWQYRGPLGLRLLGHSLGGQMILSLSDQAYHDAGLPTWKRPKRLILADPYWTPLPVGKHQFAYLAPDPSPAYRSARIAWELQGQGVSLEWIKSSPLLDWGGDNNPGLLKLAARSEITPEYLNVFNFSGRHGAAPRWYLWSRSFTDPQLAQAASQSDGQAFLNMRGAQHTIQIAGAGTPTPADDRFALVNP